MQARKLDRRGFLASCVGCLGAASCPLAAGRRPLDSPAAAPLAGNAKLRLVFTHVPPETPTWPYQGYDYEKRKKELTSRLRQACPHIDFLPATAQTAADARTILEGDGEIDGYLVYTIGVWTDASRQIALSGRPTLLVDDLHAGSGEFLQTYAAAKRKGLKVAGVASSRFEDVTEAVKAFECMKTLRSAVILNVSDRGFGAQIKDIQEVFGTRIVNVPSTDISEAYAKADLAAAHQNARRWISEAQKVLEPSEEEIRKSGLMYVAMRGLMDRHHSRAIAFDCLRLFYAGKLPAYPCLGFFQLNNDGLVGTCESDLSCAITMLLMSHLVARPGYLLNPVIDTSKNRIVYSHCVAPSKVFGPGGPSNPYHIRDHSEDRKGAAVRSFLPLGEIVTTVRFDATLREVVMHQARTVANIAEDKGCRTNLAAEVKDARKLMLEWDRHRWHRVTYFGDFKQHVDTVSALLGLKLVEEG